MSKFKILSIFGTRPEAVKMAPVVKCLQDQPQIESLICATAQHREMLDQVLSLFSIRPDFDLNLMQANQSLSALTANLFTSLDPLFEKTKPDWVLVQGDTTTVMASAICAYYHQIKVGHVEAGLRTHQKYAPFPEEINRRMPGSLPISISLQPNTAARTCCRRVCPDWRIKVTRQPGPRRAAADYTTACTRKNQPSFRRKKSA